jgi:pyrroloquinoline quinone biosynthesis protein E
LGSGSFVMVGEAAIERARQWDLAPRGVGEIGEGDRPTSTRFVAELTRRWPPGRGPDRRIGEGREDELDALAWSWLFVEAATLGVRRVCLLGGEPRVRSDLVDIVAHAREAGLDTCLVTSGIGIATRAMRDLWEAGLARVEVEMGDADAVSADRMAGQRGAFQRKHALAAEAVRLGLPLIVSFAAGRDNVGRIAAMVELALRLKAERVRIAHGADWNSTTKDMQRVAGEIERLRHTHKSRIVIDARMPVLATENALGGGEPAMFRVTPSGLVLPCAAGHAAPGSESWSVRDHPLAAILASSPGFRVGGPFTETLDAG